MDNYQGQAGSEHYNYVKRQRGFSICHRNSTTLNSNIHSSTTFTGVDNDNSSRQKLPSILIQKGEPDNDVGRESNSNMAYDYTRLNPSNTLDAAVAQNNARLLEKLLTSAANISLEGHNASGGTPVHEAAYQGKLSCLRVFLKFGADVNMRDREGWTPLHAAICGGDADTVLLLLKHGASISAAAYDGIKPVDMAWQCENEQITKAILFAHEMFREKEGEAPLAREEYFESELSL